MRAAVCTGYGPPELLELRELPKPIPKGNQILIRIHATTVTAGDCEVRRSDVPLFLRLGIRLMMGIRRPRNPLGMEMAGVVEAAGKDVTRFKVGDQVFGATGMSLGGYAEYKCLPETGVLAAKPAGITFEEAAAVPIGALEALHYLRKANIRQGHKVLIYGASGSIGTFAVQIAKYFAAEVTAVGGPTSLELLTSLGAGKVFDYTMDDYDQDGDTYDVVFDAVGKGSFSRLIGMVKKKGYYFMASPRLSHMIRGPWAGMTSGKKVVYGAAIIKSEDLLFLKEMLEAGKLRPVIDRSYPLAEIAEAHRYVDQGQKIGNVVITVEGGG